MLPVHDYIDNKYIYQIPANNKAPKKEDTTITITINSNRGNGDI